MSLNNFCPLMEFDKTSYAMIWTQPRLGLSHISLSKSVSNDPLLMSKFHLTLFTLNNLRT